jgi:hypothetical protein
MLHLKIDGRWDPEDFIEVLQGVESIYYKAVSRRRSFYEPPIYWLERASVFTTFESHLDYSNDWLLAQARTTTQGYSRLGIARIEYASPGGIDLVGLGEACKAVEGILGRLIQFFTERHLRRERDKQETIETGLKEIDLEREQESLRALKLENARAILALHRDYPDMPEEFLLALITRDQDKLIPRIAERKLIGAKTIEKSPSSGDERA